MISILFLCFFSGIVFSFVLLILLYAIPERYDILFDKTVDVAIALFLTSVLSYWYERKRDTISKVYEFVSDSESCFIDALSTARSYSDQLNNLEKANKHMSMALERAYRIRNRKIIHEINMINKGLSSCIELLNSQRHVEYNNKCKEIKELFHTLIGRISNL